MDTKEGIEYLTKLLNKYDWFDSAGLDKYGRYEVFVNYINEDVKKIIPDMIGNNKRVFYNTVLFKPGNIRKKYVTDLDFSKPKVLLQEEVELDIDYLIRQLDKLEKVCGSNILQDIFYEVHDRRNAVTNLSMKYPDVRNSMEKLYEEFGFDIIYEELDG